MLAGVAVLAAARDAREERRAVVQHQYGVHAFVPYRNLESLLKHYSVVTKQPLIN